MKPYLVGITGGSASGKTRFLKSLISQFQPHELCLLSQDNYYRSIDLQPRDAKGVENFDLPESIDDVDFAKDLASLQKGETVKRIEYTFNNVNAPDNWLTFNPAPIIIVEGIFVFHFPAVAQLLDLKVFIDAKEHIKLQRRIVRDNAERGYDLTDVLYRYQHHVSPTYERFIEPHRDEADLIIPNNTDFDAALEVMIGFLKSKVPNA